MWNIPAAQSSTDCTGSLFKVSPGPSIRVLDTKYHFSFTIFSIGAPVNGNFGKIFDQAAISGKKRAGWPGPSICYSWYRYLVSGGAVIWQVWSKLKKIVWSVPK